MKFRPEAIRSASRPFETAERSIPTRVPYAAAILTLITAVIAFGLWCVFGRISEKVHGLGLISGERPVEEITSPGDGLILTFDVRRGDVVRRGQVIGRIYSHSDQQRLQTAERRVEMYRRNHARAAEEFRLLLQKEDASDREQLAQIAKSEQRYDEQIAWYRKHVSNVAQLGDRGAVSQLQLQETRDALDRRLDSRDVLAYQRLEVISKRAPEDQKLMNSLRDHEESLDAAILECERVYRETLYRSQIIATTKGRVLGTLVAPGDRVKTGDALVRVKQQDDPYCHAVTAYFSAREARKLAVGMPAIVTPSTVRAEREGSLRGIVTAIDNDIDTRTQMICQFRNQPLVDRLLEASEHMPVRVQVQLVCDPNRPGRYEWTGGGGQDIDISPNTVCAISVAYRRHAPVALAFSSINRAFTGSGVREETVVGETQRKDPTRP